MKSIFTHRQFSFGLLLGIISSCLLSCSSPQDNPEEVEFWTMQLKPNFTQYFAELNTEFEALNEPSKIRWIDIPWSAMENKILTSISAQTAPDLVNLNPQFASQLATRNAWLDLNEAIAPEVKKSYLPEIWTASTIEGLPGR